MRQKKLGPLPTGHWLTAPSHSPCRACKRAFEAGEYVTWLALGPGRDHDARVARDKGLRYATPSLALHWECAGNREGDPEATMDPLDLFDCDDVRELLFRRR